VCFAICFKRDFESHLSSMVGIAYRRCLISSCSLYVAESGLVLVPDVSSGPASVCWLVVLVVQKNDRFGLVLHILNSTRS
jgi:hypothetical protein